MEESEGFFQPIFDLAQMVVQAIYDNMLFGISVILLMLARLIFDLTVEVSEVAFDMTKSVIEDLALSEHVQTAWTLLDPQVRGTLAYFRIPEVINNVLSYYITKYVMTYVPFI